MDRILSRAPAYRPLRPPRRGHGVSRRIRAILRQSLTPATWRRRATLWAGMVALAQRKGVPPGDAVGVRFVASLRVSQRTAAGYASTLAALLRDCGQEAPQLDRLGAACLAAGRKVPLRQATPVRQVALHRFAGRFSPEAVRELSPSQAGGAAAILLAWSVAGRLGEVVALPRRQIHLRHGGLVIDWAAETKAGPKLLFRAGRFARTSRFSRLTPVVLRLLRQRGTGEGPLTHKEEARRWLRKAPELAGMGGHSFRRGALQHLVLEAGASLEEVSRFARHAEPETTRRYLLGGLSGEPLLRMAEALRNPRHPERVAEILHRHL